MQPFIYIFFVGLKGFEPLLYVHIRVTIDIFQYYYTIDRYRIFSVSYWIQTNVNKNHNLAPKSLGQRHHVKYVPGVGLKPTTY